MEEIGGYIELEHSHGKEYHEGAIALNCGRNCLAYLIEVNQIKKIYLPFFLCSSVSDICKKYNVDICYYHLNEQLHPLVPDSFTIKDWLYVVNYYGQLEIDDIQNLKNRYQKIIVDNAQSFFSFPIEDIPTIYTCRKYFGVSDGAYLYSNKKLERSLEIDISYSRMTFLLGRFEKTANEFYNEYTENNKLFRNEPIKEMSKLTHNLLKSIDYDYIKKQRTTNFKYCYDNLSEKNKFNVKNVEGAFSYPLLLDNGFEIRKKLQTKKIYIPTLWPDVFDLCDECTMEYEYAKNILPIPIDQRYGDEEMEYIIGEIIG